MSAVTVTLTIGTTCHYWLTPKPVDFVLLDIVHGWIAEDADETSATLTLTLDDSALWDVRMTFLGIPPVEFDGLDVTGGGDLLDLLTAQGWMPL